MIIPAGSYYNTLILSLQVHIIVITGAGKAFCAGANLKDAVAGDNRTPLMYVFLSF
jgi:enoyl-CoA hydratase/carnithine racemase